MAYNVLALATLLSELRPPSLPKKARPLLCCVRKEGCFTLLQVVLVVGGQGNPLFGRERQQHRMQQEQM